MNTVTPSRGEIELAIIGKQAAAVDELRDYYRVVQVDIDEPEADVAPYMNDGASVVLALRKTLDSSETLSAVANIELHGDEATVGIEVQDPFVTERPTIIGHLVTIVGEKAAENSERNEVEVAIKSDSNAIYEGAIRAGYATSEENVLTKKIQKQH